MPYVHCVGSYIHTSPRECMPAKTGRPNCTLKCTAPGGTGTLHELSAQQLSRIRAHEWRVVAAACCIGFVCNSGAALAENLIFWWTNSDGIDRMYWECNNMTALELAATATATGSGHHHHHPHFTEEAGGRGHTSSGSSAPASLWSAVWWNARVHSCGFASTILYRHLRV